MARHFVRLLESQALHRQVHAHQSGDLHDGSGPCIATAAGCPGSFMTLGSPAYRWYLSKLKRMLHPSLQTFLSLSYIPYKHIHTHTHTLIIPSYHLNSLQKPTPPKQPAFQHYDIHIHQHREARLCGCRRRFWSRHW